MAASIYPRVKRATDVLVAGAALTLASPLIGAVAIAVRCELGSPVLFRQQRPGLHGAPFELVKFRTMLLPDQVGTEEDAARMTRLGQMLRATSLDELPTLWNVLRGDMSLVGPRPLLMSYLPLYTEQQARRHDVRPGVTGLAQVSGRNALSWEERFVLDLDYVERLTPLLDLVILWRTVTAVFRRSGISAPGQATMSVFTGTITSRRQPEGLR
ncbi:sugar transferase [Arsenicicoccus bolidensis]|uniref:Sugar transferase n=1 Tax=Arsenicicoccus bolidensis TaxID=229480 RepID=A0ABS9Q2D1_9MICO|nr:sugar transferase [Arsenicicoccus bolidensis]MCG7322024.1 sugar transferase [Arsenicicoccus bolidensis]